MRKFLTIALAAASTLGAVATTATPAAAQWRHYGWHHRWHRGWYGPRVVYGYRYGWGCSLRWRWDPYLGRHVRVRVCY